MSLGLSIELQDMIDKRHQPSRQDAASISRMFGALLVLNDYVPILKVGESEDRIKTPRQIVGVHMYRSFKL